MPTDYYNLLGIGKDATPEQIKEAYRKLVLKYHPDVNKDPKSEEKMRQLNAAYAVLSDPDKRRQYDVMGSEQFGRYYSPEDIFRGFDINTVFREMGIDFGMGGFPGFEGFFNVGNMGGGRIVERGQDILHRLNLTLEEVANGIDKEIEIKHVRKCDRCKGSGAEPGYGLVKCDVCKGSGRITVTQRSFFGSFQSVSMCGRCRGSGKVPERNCRECSGKGGTIGTDKIKVSIPPGVNDGMRLRLGGVGDYAKDVAGDLYLEVHTLKHRVLTRENDDVIANATVPFYVAALGGEISVPTLSGEIAIRIEPGTQHGTQIKLIGKGIKRFGTNQRGDEIVRINIDIPRNMTPNEKKLLEQFRDLNQDKKRFGVF